MWTGQTAHQAGMLGLVHRGFDLHEPEHHLAAYLGRHGYETALCGQQHELRKDEAEHIYDFCWTTGALPIPERDARAATHAVDYLRRPKSSPWLLSVGFFLPHRNFLPENQLFADANYIRPPEPLPDTPCVRRDMAEYYSSLAVTDRVVGLILDTLEQSGMHENTLVVLTTDHGIAFPHMKCRLTSHGTGVTLTLRHPGKIGHGVVADALVSHCDLYPTICEIAGLDTPSWVIGRSLCPLLRSGAGEIRDDLFAEVNFHAAAEPMRSVRTKRYCYIRIYDDDLRLPLANVDDGYAKDELLAAGWGAVPRERIQLYDLTLDPTEARNVAHEPRYADVLAEMEARLHVWMVETEDPLLEGPLAQPSGTKLNVRESRTPYDGPYVLAH